MNSDVDFLSGFSQFSAFLPSTTTLVWLVFFVVTFYTVIHAGVFAYHWYAYNISPSKFLKLTNIIYFTGVIVFLATLFLSTVSIVSNL